MSSRLVLCLAGLSDGSPVGNSCCAYLAKSDIGLGVVYFIGVVDTRISSPYSAELVGLKKALGDAKTLRLHLGHKGIDIYTRDAKTQERLPEILANMSEDGTEKMEVVKKGRKTRKDEDDSRKYEGEIISDVLIYLLDYEEPARVIALERDGHPTMELMQRKAAAYLKEKMERESGEEEKEIEDE